MRTRIPLTAAAILLCAGATPGATESLSVFLDGDYLRVSVPHFDFLSGRPLDRLRDGASVIFDGQVTITASPNALLPVARSIARFALSYDIWEERFSVTKISQSPEGRHTWKHLSAAAAETLCLDNLVIDRSQLPPDKDFWVQLELRQEDSKDQLGIIGDPGINITRLIEMFGRPPRGPQQRLLYKNGPFRMADLKKTEVRSVRG